MRYESLSAAYGAVWDAIGKQGDKPPPPAYLAQLLETTARLLAPPITVDPPRVALVLGDTQQVLDKLGRKKIAFYDAALDQPTRTEWAQLSQDVQREAERIREENTPQEVNKPAGGVLLQERQTRHEPTTGAKIELLD